MNKEKKIIETHKAQPVRDDGTQSYIKPKRTLYICNRKRCANCLPECSHTTEARFAKNFIIDEFGDLVEKQEGAVSL